jgi:two-component SAPR family response regulator
MLILGALPRKTSCLMQEGDTEHMAPQQVRVRLLGGFDVQVDGVAVPAGAWRLGKARSLLKLLALAEGHRMHRDAVVEALWPDLRAAAATNNLHQTLHSARRALAVAGATADVLRLRDGVVTLCPECVLGTDVQDLEAALDKALLRTTLTCCSMSPRGVLRDCCLRTVTKTGRVGTKITLRTCGARLCLLQQPV